jgi:hypothetical protein
VVQDVFAHVPLKLVFKAIDKGILVALVYLQPEYDYLAMAIIGCRILPPKKSIGGRSGTSIQGSHGIPFHNFFRTLVVR